ncbi:Kelch-like protein 7 [Oryzias melastigma]|uniref:Kelch-like protein 7 n=1 Tax=Oryzias melastigma TaxID=30732 RepID=A0A834BPV3_ORYME|nr:Kelch-like protein 7 [Oryzias melastigma]
MASQWKIPSNTKNKSTTMSDTTSYELSRVVESMNSLRKEGAFCDVTLVVQGKRFLVHKVILAAASQFFRLLFSTNMMESGKDEVELREISSDIVQLVIGFIYTAQVSVNNGNMEALLYAADYFHINPMKNVCVDFIKRQITTTNCLDIAVLAERTNCPGLKTRAESVVRRNFATVCRTKRFLQLDVTTLTHLLRQEKLDVFGEEEIYKVALHWLKHDLSSRKQHKVEVLSCVRFPLISKSFLLKTVQAEPLLLDSLECVTMLLEGFRYHFLGPQDRLNLGAISRPRQLNSNRIAVFKTSWLSSCCFFNPKDNSWTEVRCSFEPRQGGVAVFWDREVYILGGSSCSGPTMHMDCYNINLDFCYSKLRMLSPRSNLAACSSRGKIYTSGGATQSDEGLTALDLFESYDIRSESWQVETSMLTPRCQHGSVEADGLIYVCGGRLSDGRVLDNCEVYNPSTKEWTRMCAMREARKGHGLVVVGNRIFAVGGSGPQGGLRSVEYFEIGSSTWRRATPMPRAVHTVKCAAVGDVIYVLAESCMSTRLRNVLEYQVKVDRWELNPKAKHLPNEDFLICAVRK